VTIVPNSSRFHRSPFGLFAGAVAFVFVCSLSARADTIKMANGESLQGTVVQETSEFILFRSASFGEINIRRTAGMVIDRTSAPTATVAQSTSPAAGTSAPATPAGPASGPAGAPPPPTPSLVTQVLGLSDRWSVELEANLLVQNDKFHATSRGTELTIGYKVPNATKPAQARHEYGLFGAYNFQKVNDTVVGENTEIAVRYFFQPISRWLLVSQADWTRDRINGIESRSHIIAVPSYRLIDTKPTRLLAGIGPSFLSDTQIVSTGPDVTHKESGFRLAFYELFQQTITPALTFRQTLLVLGRPRDPNATYNLRFEASLRRMLTQHLSLNLAYDYVRDDNDFILPDNTPFPSESIATLKLMLGYRF
jgi:putative salt-induced outer membrane protein YdiY